MTDVRIGTYEDALKEIVALRAENAKLLEALDWIADTPMKWTKPQGDVYWSNVALALAKKADDARAALQKDEGE